MKFVDPKVSVVMIVHRDDNFLPMAIESVLNQSLVEFELIIVENGCNDILFNKLRNYRDPRIRLFRTRIPQISFNRNYALNEAKAELVAVMDSDDICMSQRLLKQYSFMIANSSVDVLSSSFFRIDEFGAVLNTVNKKGNSTMIKKMIWKTNPICHPTVMFRKKKIIELGGYLGGVRSEDYDLWLRLISLEGVGFAVLEEPLVSYRVHTNSCQKNFGSYCETAGHFLREFLQKMTLLNLSGLVVSCSKALVEKIRVLAAR